MYQPYDCDGEVEVAVKVPEGGVYGGMRIIVTVAYVDALGSGIPPGFVIEDARLEGDTSNSDVRRYIAENLLRYAETIQEGAEIARKLQGSCMIPGWDPERSHEVDPESYRMPELRGIEELPGRTNIYNGRNKFSAN